MVMSDAVDNNNNRSYGLMKFPFCDFTLDGRDSIDETNSALVGSGQIFFTE